MYMYTCTNDNLSISGNGRKSSALGMSTESGLG